MDRRQQPAQMESESYQSSETGVGKYPEDGRRNMFLSCPFVKMDRRQQTTEMESESVQYFEAGLQLQKFGWSFLSQAICHSRQFETQWQEKQGRSLFHQESKPVKLPM